jgi:valine--pyruvate aminotransferase
MKFSIFGEKVKRDSGIKSLMDDLGNAMAVNRNMLMLGGGNPAHIPRVQEIFRKSMENILNNGNCFEECIGNYDSPQGNARFIDNLVSMLKKEYAWDIGPENIMLTNGSQSAFFLLFNMFSGNFPDGSFRKILLPLTPEYIGYSDAGYGIEEIFTSIKPDIHFEDNNIFKYHIDFENLSVGDDIGAICVSRPTNPTGNLLSDNEIEKLVKIASSKDIPLIIDNAYGTPFPDIVFTEVRPFWNENIVVCLSLSKLGLPGVRTGIVVASEKIIAALSRINAVMNLAPGSVGAVLAGEMVRTGEIINISRNIIQPYYKEKADFAVNLFREHLKGTDFFIHKPEGAIFLWLWFRGIKISSHELYKRLKERGVLVVSGHYFFPGLADPWQHRDECIRVTYSQSNEVVEKGIKIIADEVRKYY